MHVNIISRLLTQPHSPFPFVFSDWNGSKRGHVYKFLRSQGFVSSYDTAHQYTDADAHKVVIKIHLLVLNHYSNHVTMNLRKHGH